MRSAKVSGRTLTLSLAGARAGTVRASVKRGSTFVAKAAARKVGASTRTLRLTLDRKLRRGTLHGQGDRRPRRRADRRQREAQAHALDDRVSGRHRGCRPEISSIGLKFRGQMADGVIKPMRVDTSLLQGISAANQATRSSSASLKSTGTTTSFSSALKSAAEKETTKAVPGQNYAEILTGSRAGMYLNTGGGARDGEAFVLVKHDGREDHIYGTGADRKVVTVGGDKSESARQHARFDRHQDFHPTTTSDKTASAEKTKQVAGRGYADILNGTRSGMYLNTSGNKRDGDAFVLVKRDDREYHIYGTGKDREIFSVKAPATKTATDATPTRRHDDEDVRRRPGQDRTDTTTPTGPLVTNSTQLEPRRARTPAGSPPAVRAADRPRAGPTPARA